MENEKNVRVGSCYSVSAVFGSTICTAQDNTAGGDLEAKQSWDSPVVTAMIVIGVVAFILMVVWMLRGACKGYTVVKRPHGNEEALQLQDV
ncbi:ORF3 [Cyclopterus lumpus toti-like virus]|uniref:ORF3 n=1 Tax=Cyclopterus lumpus toti-like virus TaxID=2859664 RepID=A0A8F9R329_9VIRU|nr:ORF3 [Cyclopterus lumpus toti-like virus]